MRSWPINTKVLTFAENIIFLTTCRQQTLLTGNFKKMVTYNISSCIRSAIISSKSRQNRYSRSGDSGQPPYWPRGIKKSKNRPLHIRLFQSLPRTNATCGQTDKHLLNLIFAITKENTPSLRNLDFFSILHTGLRFHHMYIDDTCYVNNIKQRSKS